MSRNNIIYDDRLFGKQGESRLYNDGDVIPVSGISQIVKSALLDALTDYHSRDKTKTHLSENKKINIDERLIELLQDSKYPGRTIRGLSKELGIHSSEVFKRLSRGTILGRRVKVFPRRNQRGEKVFTLSSKFSATASWLDKFIDAMAIRK